MTFERLRRLMDQYDEGFLTKGEVEGLVFLTTLRRLEADLEKHGSVETLIGGSVAPEKGRELKLRVVLKSYSAIVEKL